MGIAWAMVEKQIKSIETSLGGFKRKSVGKTDSKGIIHYGIYKVDTNLLKTPCASMSCVKIRYSAMVALNANEMDRARHAGGLFGGKMMNVFKHRLRIHIMQNVTDKKALELWQKMNLEIINVIAEAENPVKGLAEGAKTIIGGVLGGIIGGLTSGNAKWIILGLLVVGGIIGGGFLVYKYKKKNKLDDDYTPYQEATEE